MWRMLGLLAVLASCDHGEDRPLAGPLTPWRATTLRDLAALHAMLAADHPGAVDGENPAFHAWLFAGYAGALAEVDRVRDAGGHAAVLRRYVAGFRDGHTALQLAAPPARWPGFTVQLRDGAYRVATSSGTPPVGATLVACDGRTPAELMRANIFPFVGDPRLEAHWTRYAPLVLVDDGNPFVTRPRRCELDTTSVELAWQPLAADARAALLRSATAAHGVTFVDDAAWIAIPSFMNVLVVGEVEQHAARIRAAARIVLDVRGNTGGSSTRGVAIANAIWGRAYVDAATTTEAAGRPPIAIDWRTSPAVEQHVAGLALLVGGDLGPYLRDVAAGIAAARAAGNALYHEPTAPPPRAQPLPAPATRARVYLLTDGACASACLDFADLVLRAIPRVTHVGAPTSADTQYMEVRRATLPSGAGVVLPTKIWRHRPRGNAPYTPTHRLATDATPADLLAQLP